MLSSTTYTIVTKKILTETTLQILPHPASYPKKEPQHEQHAGAFSALRNGVG
jgi:hypothetical protein